MDVAGENQLDIDHDMSKQRLSPAGEPIGDPFSEVVSRTELGEGALRLKPQPACTYCHSRLGPGSRKTSQVVQGFDFWPVVVTWLALAITSFRVISKS